ncbi:MAG: substrate-binding domain-containing protein [Verrucomicrobiota bacterium]
MRCPLFLLSALFAVSLQAAPLRIVGSDLLSPVLDRGLAAYAERNDREITVKLEGSGIGLDSLRRGEADLGVLMFAPGAPLPSEEFLLLPVAYQTAVLAMRSSIPVSQLSYSQIGGIYGDSEQKNHRRWSDVGASGPWGARSILPVAVGRQGGLAFDLLRAETLKSNRLKPSVVQFNTPAEAIRRVSGDEGGIAVLLQPPPEDSGLKVVLVSREDQGVAYPPTPDNLHNGDYPLRLPVYLVARKADINSLNQLLRFLLGEEALPLWEQAGLISAPVQSRNQLIFDLEVM